MDYEHTQKTPLGWILALTGLVILFIGWTCSRGQSEPLLISSAVALILIFVGLCFGRLTVRDEKASLAVIFGPLPIFGTRILYSEITDIRADRSNILDGWGVHWMPGRGWTYNVWGFDCVRIQLGRKVVRMGTDDKEGLLAFLKTRLDLEARP